jgi:hypothetical protein
MYKNRLLLYGAEYAVRLLSILTSTLQLQHGIKMFQISPIHGRKTVKDAALS